MKSSTILSGAAITAALTLTSGSLAVAASPAAGDAPAAATGEHPAVVVARRVERFDYANKPYRHPAGGESIQSGAAPERASGASYVHVAKGVGSAEAANMLRIAADYASSHIPSTLEQAVPGLSVRVRASYVIEDKVINEVQLSGRFAGQYQGVGGHGGLVSESRMEIYQIANGKVVETWTSVSEPGIEQQLAWATAENTQLAE